MKRIFNSTGTCIPGKHFVADVSGKLDRLMEMVDRGDYFTIDRPRQYGKTTVMYLLIQRLHKDKNYLVLDTSFEGIDSSTYAAPDRFIPALLDLLNMRLDFAGEKDAASLIEKNSDIRNFGKLSRFFTRFVEESGRKVVLMIDEVDKSSNNQLFLDFLGMLRTKYLAQHEGKDRSFHSVILAGVHDIKTLKAKIRPDEEQKYNSPWNIAVDFELDLSLFPGEIAPMLADYAKERNVKMDIPFTAERIFYFTSGYPFLVSYLCKIIDETILPEKREKEWTPRDLDEAVQIALKKDNTNSRSLIKNLENNPDLYDFVFNIVMNQSEFSYNRDNPLIDFGVIYGIFREVDGKTRVHNRIYEQRIFNYMSSKLETSGRVNFSNITGSYLDKEGHLDVESIIRKFQGFMIEQYGEKDRSFIERNGRLLFLAFIKPIINGKGFDFKEVQISDEKRLDIAVTFLDRKYIIELKIWRGESHHQAGIRQLCDYLDRQNETRGFLLVYDLRKESGFTGRCRTIKESGKEIFTAWV